MKIDWLVSLIMTIAIINCISTSLVLETIILFKKMLFKLAFKTAIVMSIVFIISMKAAINLTDFILTGRAILTC